ncbi:MAG: Asp-tRNA(Asn)/Glu-tRNA(Gln) amidotransferase subunit GatB [Spirochaetaceae bacterium]|nr:Asp-tRNA(Asn)/Glu-tRNA(Gln) amidotransferase subunit GatB [Spirochaetaceae bacterium]
MSALEYEIIIGCEIHCQLATKTKAFCACENKYGGMPNSRVCPVCLGLPGALPNASKEYVELGVKAGLALGCTIHKVSHFDRKHYFYPDLSKGFQITQYDAPLCTEGSVSVNVAQSGEPARFKTVRIERIHLEEDAGKSLHLGDSHSYIDYNRCGVPLIEIVSYPDMRSPEEAAAYMHTVREILTFIGVTDGNLEEGALRCDVNVNLKISDNGKEFRTRISEIKNINSYRAVHDACAYEAQRQLDEYISGKAEQFGLGFKRTCGWDDINGRTVVQRTKTDKIDYRFMSEPDLPTIVLTDDFVEKVSKTVGELPEAKRTRFLKDFNLSDFDVQTLTSQRELCLWFEEAALHTKDVKKLANWILKEALAVVNERSISIQELPFSPNDLAELVNTIDDGRITSKQAKDVFAQMLATGKTPKDIIVASGYEQVSDVNAIEKFVDEVLAENASAIEDWKNGKTNVAGWLMGQVMKKSQGRANPSEATKLVTKKLSELK